MSREKGRKRGIERERERKRDKDRYKIQFNSHCSILLSHPGHEHYIENEDSINSIGWYQKRNEFLMGDN